MWEDPLLPATGQRCLTAAAVTHAAAAAAGSAVVLRQAQVRLLLQDCLQFREVLKLKVWQVQLLWSEEGGGHNKGGGCVVEGRQGNCCWGSMLLLLEVMVVSWDKPRMRGCDCRLSVVQERLEAAGLEVPELEGGV